MTLSNSFLPLLGISIPGLELILICLFGATLPIAFFFWISWWLGSVKDENPDEAIAAQAKADASHHGHPGQGHGHAHGH